LQLRGDGRGGATAKKRTAQGLGMDRHAGKGETNQTGRPWRKNVGFRNGFRERRPKKKKGNLGRSDLRKKKTQRTEEGREIQRPSIQITPKSPGPEGGAGRQKRKGKLLPHTKHRAGKITNRRVPGNLLRRGGGGDTRPRKEPERAGGEKPRA